MEELVIGTMVFNDLFFVFKGTNKGLSSIEIKDEIETTEIELPKEIKHAFLLALEGRTYKLPNLSLPSLTPFRAKVLNTIRNIPFGHTITYKEVAKAIGNPNAARAVGQVMAQNPIPIFFP